MRAIPLKEIRKLLSRDRIKAEILDLVEKGELKTVEILEAEVSNNKITKLRDPGDR